MPQNNIILAHNNIIRTQLILSSQIVQKSHRFCVALDTAQVHTYLNPHTLKLIFDF